MNALFHMGRDAVNAGCIVKDQKLNMIVLKRSFLYKSTFVRMVRVKDS